MPVAKSYQSLKILSEPFEKSGRLYINVQLKNGQSKAVRWYSDKEYTKMYPDNIQINCNDKYHKSQKEILGFKLNFITIFKGINKDNEQYFSLNDAFRYCRYWGWYIISTEQIPDNLPLGVSAIKLNWDIIAKDNENIKTGIEIERIINNFLSEFSISKAQGQIGERINRKLTVINVELKEDKWGISTLYTFKDENNNLYTWNTKTKNYLIDMIISLNGTIKGYENYNGEIYTILTRCKEN